MVICQTNSELSKNHSVHNSVVMPDDKGFMKVCLQTDKTKNIIFEHKLKFSLMVAFTKYILSSKLKGQKN